MRYIDADRLRAEINRRIKIHDELSERPEMSDLKLELQMVDNNLRGIISFIDSLQQEQPEVDFEKEIDFFLYGTYTPERFPNTMQVRDEHTGLKVNDWKFWVNNPEYKVEFARHFYELGLKRKEE